MLEPEVHIATVVPAPLYQDVATTPESGDDQNLVEFWRERRIHWSGLSRGLRLGIIGTVVLALVVVVVILTRAVPQPMYSVPLAADGSNVGMPTVAFFLTLGIWTLAWTCALTGVLFVGGYARWLAPVLFVVDVVLTNVSDLKNIFSTRYYLPVVLVVLWMVVVSVVLWVRRRRGLLTPSWLPALSFVCILLCLIAHFALLWFDDWQLTQLAPNLVLIFPMQVVTEVTTLVVLLVPLMTLAGSDIAEWSVAISEQINDGLLRVRRAPRNLALAVATFVVATAILVYQVGWGSGFPGWTLASVLTAIQFALFGLVVVALIWAIARIGRVSTWPRMRLPAMAMVAGAAILTAGVTVPSLLALMVIYVVPPTSFPATDSVFTHAAKAYSPAFSIAYRSDYQVAVYEPVRLSEGVAATFTSDAQPGTPMFIVSGYPANGVDPESIDQFPLDNVKSFCTDLNCEVLLTPEASQGLWTVNRTVVHDTVNNVAVETDGWEWTRGDGDTLWALYGSALPSWAAADRPLFTEMVNSFKPDLSARTPDTVYPAFAQALIDLTPDPAWSIDIIPCLLSLGCGLFLLLRGRRRPGAGSVAGLFLAMLGVWIGFKGLPYVLRYAGVTTTLTIAHVFGSRHLVAYLPSLSLGMAQMLIAAFSLAWVGWLAWRRQIATHRAQRILTTLLLLNVGSQVIIWIWTGLGASDTFAATFTAAQGILLVGAFLWDFLTAGATFNSADSQRSPRYARMLLYLGYTLLSFALTLLLSTVASSAADGYAVGDWTLIGLAEMGMAMIATLAIMRFARAGVEPLPAGAPATTAPEAPQVAPPPLP